MTACGSPLCQLKERKKKEEGLAIFEDAVKIEEHFSPFQAREAHEAGAARRGGGR